MDSSETKPKHAQCLDAERQSIQHGDLTCLDGLNFQPEGTRKLTPLQTISASWIICDSWAGVAATVALAIVQGGPVTLVYGLILIFFLVGACTLTLAELASAYPTAGGQYHWTSVLAPRPLSRALSYCCGVSNMLAWIAICTGIAIIPAQLILGIVLFYDSEYQSQPWHYFLIYQSINGLVLLYNTTLLKKSLWFHDVSFFVTLTSFVIIMVTCLARSASHYQPSDTVWATFLNGSGWNSGGVAFLTGLVSPNYMYAGIDGALHLAEECQNATTAVPRALMSTLVIGFITSFAFMVTMLYCTSDLDAVVASSTGVPIYEMWYQATRSPSAATVFVCLLVLAAIFALTGAQQTASRLTWSLARDRALIGSQWIGELHDSLEVPVWALVFNYAVMFLIGCIYLGSSSAFNAFIGTGLVLQHISYAFPAVMLLYRCRSAIWLPDVRPFRLPSPVGWAANLTTVCFAVLVLIFYDFPTVMPVTGSNMNYTPAVLGAMTIVAGINWVVYARKSYQGPRLRRFREEGGK
ncbi:amino acid/polyamine transporter I [Aspergillus pseudonomiae]|uniref:Amino acid/polyamine transporter I n=1 Tax=Aspergillus pseudonomiae TaxID=1506151 RepID=A0A5N6I5W3_9EURO|nr:amino acid/polyamine transporter I [Aspergillus pseudonomiae]KAB8261427.1 amino acid/polyamine transporter I [Aspergillus pseudonomiae]KAE8400091.1 amino acid/polyamine transporter I [Aspergillus pseudonomiae]